MRVSFVIVNYNRKDELLVTISKTKETIKRVPGEFEIIIVDNASSDGSTEAVKSLFPDVVLIENKINIGAPAWNEGFAIAKGKYFIILDDDSHIEYGLTEALEYLDNNEQAGVLALNVKGGLYQTTGWKNLSETAGFIGCGFIMRKELYKEIGGYADWMFLYANEWEYGIRCLEAGHKVIYFENCLAYHRASTIHRTNKRLIVNSVRNEMAIVYKYFNKDQRTRYLTRVFLNNVKGIFKYGLSSAPWYFEAFKEFRKLKRTLAYTPVKKEVENFYSKKVWWTLPFLGIY